MTQILITIAVAIVVAVGTVFVMNEYRPAAVDAPERTDTEVETDTAPNEQVNEVSEVKAVDVKPPTSSGAALDLSGQNLTKTPGYVFERTQLETLDLSDNQLAGALQAEIRHLQNLRVLDLSDNRFTGVPAEIGQLSNLEVLDLSNNELTGLPYELGNLGKLKTLDLRGNSYSTLDLGIIKEKLPASTVIYTD